MASSSSRLRMPPPAPERLGRDLGSVTVTSTHASADLAAAVSPSRDVIFEILSWLPAKSLWQYQCVSKEWRAVISNPAFVALRRSRPEPLLVAMCLSKSGRKNLQLIDTEGTIMKVVIMEDLRGVENWTLQASLGNLACITAGYDHSGTLMVDLATGKTLLACLEPAKDVAAVPPKHYTCFGFGRARQSGSLKVFRVAIPRPVDNTETCEVLTLGDGAKWRQTKLPPTTLSLWHSTSSGVAVNGALHFLPEDKGDYVLSFDLDNEKWKMIHGPRGVKEAMNIAELNGALCMLHRVQNVTNIWLLGDSDENIWSKAYKIRKAPFSEFAVPGGELVFYYYDNTGNRVLQVYDPRSRKCTKVKTPTNLVGRIGLCNSNLDPRFCC